MEAYTPSGISRQRMEVMKYLQGFGLDGSTISADDIKREGYRHIWEEFYRPWPTASGFDYDHLLRLINVATLAEYREAGIR